MSLLRGLALVLPLTLPLLASAQLGLLWSADQGSMEAGWLYTDLNGDGLEELIKEDGLGTVFLDGDGSYATVWSVVDPAPDSNAWFSLAAREGNSFIFTRVNTTSQQSEVLVYNAMANAPAWTSGTLSGVLYRTTSDDLYGTGQKQLAAAWNRLVGTAYASGWRVWNLATGAVSYNPGEGAGYLIGPWSGPMETTAASQLIFNRYPSAGSPTLECWGIPVVAVAAPAARPEQLGLQAWPNPFNPVCRIALAHAPAGDFSLRITNVRGALVREIALVGNGGPLELVWDGRNQQGRPLPSGSYQVMAAGEAIGVTLVH
ncbi:MAG: hypothetical protein H6678_06520 [Candidatus Delongbacteria bacterium]|nr:hypothetical protein [Candidatus Delongbacteria bacterium]